ncbi:hypothetical protein APUTEX25_000567, partial [Auxenochlorella protothecoides]
PDVPHPQLLESQGGSQATAGGGPFAPGGGDGRPGVPSILPLSNMDFASMQAHPELFANLTWMSPAHFPVPPSQEEGGATPEAPPSGRVRGGGGGKPTRRGPMDEMRQLVRILVKLLPQSVGHIGASDEAGGGNRISEEQIKHYLDATLGAAPRPTWGVPTGWYGYVATLLSWAAGRPVSEEAARRVAKREPGRSWEAIEPELHALGVHPNAWPLPLSLEGVQAAEADPVPQPVPLLPPVRRASEDGAGGGGARRGRMSTGGSQAGFDLDRASEMDAWRHLVEVLAALPGKAGSTPAEQGGALAALKSDAKIRLDGIVAGAAAAAGMGLGMFSGL